MTGDVFEVTVHLLGCDDCTTFDIHVDEDGYMLLKKLQAKSEEVSDCVCMPKLKVEK